MQIMSRGIDFNYGLLYREDHSLYIVSTVNTFKTLRPYISNKDQLRNRTEGKLPPL